MIASRRIIRTAALAGACVVLTATAAFAAPSKMSGETKIDGAPVTAGVNFSKKDDPIKVKKLKLGSPDGAIIVDCENGQQLGITIRVDDLDVKPNGTFETLRFVQNRVEGRFNRNNAMKGTYEYEAEVSFGGGPPTTCGTDAPEPFAAKLD